MAGLKLCLIFLVVLIIDSLVLSAFFGLRESFLSLLVLVVPILYIGSTRRVIAYGLIFAFVSESLRGLKLGDLAIPFLFTAIVIYFVQRFLDIKYTYDTRFGLSKSALVALTSAVSIYIFSFFYKQGVNLNYFDPVTALIIISEALMLVFAFNIIFNKKADYAR